ncbi:serine hydrolase [cf. Phormidesmis sp. LEGE 11477]|uniref:serine hydrolase domain-containing protein n=1 Tax=cf. Phormidesmis sp. LEGE 11477 TaxID=1828680 RepID=UPI001880D1C7|nr:serine hydrolase domain-containing protein [cf. Phormidesmis sp. LEGE 11477]MBE9064888.1 beta-lactamase family protein [cf. Phormidesmis sp. LEGE 11477]
MTPLSFSATTNNADDSTRLIESDRTLATLQLDLDEAPPASGVTVSISSAGLSEFDLSQLQTVGAAITPTTALSNQLDTYLSSRVTETVPGISVAITSPFGDLSKVSGTANLENNTPVEKGDRFEVGSITKTFTATTLLKLVEAGILTLEDTLTDWLPANVTDSLPNASEITLRQLLNHTSGVAEYDSILIEQGQQNPLVFLRDWQPEEIVALIGEADPFFAPGEGWQYSNTNFILAGMVVEAATGNDLAAEVRSQIIDPLELDNTFFGAAEDIPEG